MISERDEQINKVGKQYCHGRIEPVDSKINDRVNDVTRSFIIYASQMDVPIPSGLPNLCSRFMDY